MDKFEVVLLSPALKFYNKCPVKVARQLNDCFEALERNPFSGPNIKLLKTRKSQRWYRYRVGMYRVVYEIDKENKKVGILLISSRSSAYKNI